MIYNRFKRRYYIDQIKIGKFIAERRRSVNLTQMQLAERLGITDRAVSKWENGRAMPDSSIMLELCDVLGISVNDLLCGEISDGENYKKEVEGTLLGMAKEKEEGDRRLLGLEVVMFIVAFLPVLTSLLLVLLIPMEEWVATAIMLTSMMPLLIATPFAIRIEQIAGYYRCKSCGHTYVPRYTSVFFAMHMGRNRHMVCPMCKKRAWHEKVMADKEIDEQADGDRG